MVFNLADGKSKIDEELNKKVRDYVNKQIDKGYVTASVSDPKQIAYCVACGQRLCSAAKFCGKCGVKIGD
jgi:hypothetical protein